MVCVNGEVRKIDWSSLKNRDTRFMTVSEQAMWQIAKECVEFVDMVSKIPITSQTGDKLYGSLVRRARIICGIEKEIGQ